jgi:prepilin-type N-terminal cleavage/methylation domain-containing protein
MTRQLSSKLNVPVRTLRSAGFTLLELLTALVIVGVLTSLAVPSLAGQIARIKTESVLNALVGDLYYARMMAVRSGNRVEVRFRTTPGSSCASSYDIVQLGSPTRTLKSVSVNSGTRGVCLDPGTAGSSLVYNSRGLPHGLGTGTISASSGKVSAQVVQAKAGRLYRAY